MSKIYEKLKEAEGKPGYWSVTDVVSIDDAAKFFK